MLCVGNSKSTTKQSSWWTPRPKNLLLSWWIGNRRAERIMSCIRFHRLMSSFVGMLSVTEWSNWCCMFQSRSSLDCHRGREEFTRGGRWRGSGGGRGTGTHAGGTSPPILPQWSINRALRTLHVSLDVEKYWYLHWITESGPLRP